MSESESREALAYAVATWVFLLHVDGVAPGDAELASRCVAVMGATEENAGNAAGTALVERVRELLTGDEPGDVAAFASTVYGARAFTDLGAGSRDDRVHRIRKHQFSRNLPWLARIWERVDGRVAPSWLLIERVTDEVCAMDPNPWNDIDEERHLPVHDFQVLWELDGCTAVAVA